MNLFEIKVFGIYLIFFDYRALSGRTHASLSNIILFIIRYIGDQRFTRVLIDVANTLLDVYEHQFHEFTGPVGRSFINLTKALQKEERVSRDFLQMHGAIELVLAGANVGEISTTESSPLDINKLPKEFSEFTPSEAAKKEVIFDVN